MSCFPDTRRDAEAWLKLPVLPTIGTVAAAATVRPSSQNIGQHFDPLQIAFAHRHPAHF